MDRQALIAFEHGIRSIKPVARGSWRRAGRCRRFRAGHDGQVHHLLRAQSFEIDAEGIDTIGGFVFTRLGYVPSSGTKLEIPGLAITVRHTGRKRIEEVLLQKTTPEAFEAAA